MYQVPGQQVCRADCFQLGMPALGEEGLPVYVVGCLLVKLGRLVASFDRMSGTSALAAQDLLACVAHVMMLGSEAVVLLAYSAVLQPQPVSVVVQKRLQVFGAAVQPVSVVVQDQLQVFVAAQRLPSASGARHLLGSAAF